MGPATDKLVGFQLHEVDCSDYDTLSSMVLSCHPELAGILKDTYRKMPHLILNLLTDSSGCKESYPSWLLSGKWETIGPTRSDSESACRNVQRRLLSSDRTARG